MIYFLLIVFLNSFSWLETNFIDKSNIQEFLRGSPFFHDWGLGVVSILIIVRGSGRSHKYHPMYLIIQDSDFGSSISSLLVLSPTTASRKMGKYHWSIGFFPIFNIWPVNIWNKILKLLNRIKLKVEELEELTETTQRNGLQILHSVYIK